MVEDHPLDYASFEGSIPRGEYGAGQVIVWDRGTYSPDEKGELSFDDRTRAEERMRGGLANGKLSISLRGEKLRGSWTLVRMQRSEKNWLLIKHRDKHADPRRDIMEEEASVVSGLTIDDIKAGHVTAHREIAAGPGSADGAVKAAFPPKLSPMLASQAANPFSDERWLFEPKLDGFRTLAFLNDGKVRLQSRRGIDVTEHYPDLAESIKGQPASQLVLDGEIIALDSKGRLCFQCLQGYLKSFNRFKVEEAEPPSAIIYYVFDILYLDGYDLREVPLDQRKKMLYGILDANDYVRLVEGFAADGQTVYRAAIENGLEGVIAKRQDSLYETGKRSHNWLKIKAVNSDDFVVGGFTRGAGSRSESFGALLLGYYDDDNNLQYAGNVGSGFDNETLSELKKRLEDIKAEKSPFYTGPEPTAGVTWANPELVVEVKFTEWTRDGRLRAPVFLRTRGDKPAASATPARVVETEVKSSVEDSKDRADVPEDVLEQLSSPKDSFKLDVKGQHVSLSNLDKTLWPETDVSRALTKRDLITYLARVSPWLLLHLRDRTAYPEPVSRWHLRRAFLPEALSARTRIR
jgi:bifunctional non-homologous end joining protein LigD